MLVRNVVSKPAGGVMTQRHEEGLGFILSRLKVLDVLKHKNNRICISFVFKDDSGRRAEGGGKDRTEAAGG